GRARSDRAPRLSFPHPCRIPRPLGRQAPRRLRRVCALHPYSSRRAVSNTSNFDYCVQLGLAPLKAVFHLALKNEELFPHNVGPLARDFGGHAAVINVRLLDDADSAADLALEDEKHIRFSLPIEIGVEIADAPDPSLSRVVLKATIEAPGALATWP